jgi:sec1 family domain-containing protein 1
MTSAPTSQPSQGSTSSELFKGFSSLSNRLTSGFKEAGIGTNLENLISGVKNFLPQNRDLTLTKITESLMDPQNASSAAIARTEHYLYFDPRSANARGTMPPAIRAGGASASAGANASGSGAARGIEASFGQRRQGFSEAIVFTIGGGSIDEYGNLQEWVTRTSGGVGGASTGLPRRRVVYGSTEIIAAEDFIKSELARLGKES